MHAMLMAVLILPVVGAVLLWFEPWNRANRFLVHALGATAFILAPILLALLIFARHPTCRVLGGEWNPSHSSCLSEWGGVLDGGGE